MADINASVYGNTQKTQTRTKPAVYAYSKTTDGTLFIHRNVVASMLSETIAVMDFAIPSALGSYVTGMEIVFEFLTPPAVVCNVKVYPAPTDLATGDAQTIHEEIATGQTLVGTIPIGASGVYHFTSATLLSVVLAAMRSGKSLLRCGIYYDANTATDCSISRDTVPIWTLTEGAHRSEPPFGTGALGFMPSELRRDF